MGGRLSGFFTDNGILGMLEATGYEGVDNVSPFLARLWTHYACVSESDTVHVTEVFSKYTVLKNFIRRRLVSPGWTKCELNEPESRINDFRTVAVKVSEPYQAVCTGVSKWPYLSYLVT